MPEPQGTAPTPDPDGDLLRRLYTLTPTELVEEVNAMTEPKGTASMTVHELWEALSHFPPDTPVVLNTGREGWRTILRIDPPVAHPQDDVQRAVALTPGERVDLWNQ